MHLVEGTLCNISSPRVVDSLYSLKELLIAYGVQ